MKIPTKADLRNPCVAFLPNAEYVKAYERLWRYQDTNTESNSDDAEYRAAMELRTLYRHQGIKHPNQGRILVMGLTGTAEIPDAESHMSEILDNNSSVRGFLDRQGVPSNDLVVGMVDPRLYNHLIATLDFSDIYVLN